MALSGIQIQKLLPKTNCKECGSSTCLAFAMKLAAKKADLSECPYASQEAKDILGADSQPPVKGITIGKEKPLRLGEETVLYRHEKTFVNPTVLAINIDDDDSHFDETLNNVHQYVLERVGECLTVGAIAVTQKGSDAQFVAAVQKAYDTTRLPIIMHSQNAEALTLAAKAIPQTGSILAFATPQTAETLSAIAQENGHILAITAPDVNGVAEMATALKDMGFDQILLSFGAHSLAESFQINTIARRAALKDNIKSMGYPSITFVQGGAPMQEAAFAINEINKYGGICVLPGFDPSQIVALLALRLNIYTDPQKPIQVEPKIYEIGEPDGTSPVFVTTNFSLTYFIVSGELENSGISAFLAIPECEGFSVLTAWAAGKFSGASIGKFIKESGLEERLQRKRLVIPGYVSQISGELEEALPGWEILVGPQEAADLEGFIKTVLS